MQRFAGVGRGARSAVALDDPAFAAALGSADLAVNATTVGMLDPGATIPVELLPAEATVFDLVYVPAETPLLAAARARGLRAANGSEMLIAQAAIAFERWTGVGGMADVMRAAVAPLLADARPGPDRCGSRRSSRTAGRRSRSCVDDRVPAGRDRRPGARSVGPRHRGQRRRRRSRVSGPGPMRQPAAAWRSAG